MAKSLSVSPNQSPKNIGFADDQLFPVMSSITAIGKTQRRRNGGFAGK
jgi:hypothetical protein